MPCNFQVCIIRMRERERDKWMERDEESVINKHKIFVNLCILERGSHK